MATKKRRAKSKVHRAPYRARFEQLLREDRHTLDEMYAIIRAEFPDAEVSRSGLHRYDQGFSVMTERMREIDRAAQTLVGELGEGIGEKSGQLLAQAVTTLATDAALKMQTKEEVSVEEVRKLARAAKDAIDTQRVSVNVRKAVAAEAREALLREQASALDKVVKAGGLSAEAAADIRASILGIRTAAS